MGYFYFILLSVLAFPISLVFGEEVKLDTTITRIDKKTVPKEIIDYKLIVKSSKFIDDPDGSKKIYVVIEGSFYEPAGWKLFSNNKPVTLKPNRKFWLAASFRPYTTEFSLTTQGPNGELKSGQFLIKVTEIKEPPKLSFNIFLGITNNQYNERSRADFTQTSFDLGLNTAYWFDYPSWNVEGGMTSDAFVFLSTNKKTSANFFKIYGQVAYSTPLFSPTWTMKLNLGFEYFGMFSKKGTFGYSGLIVPQLYPAINKRIKSSDIYGYIKYMTLAKTLTLKSNEAEWGGGLGWIINKPNFHKWIFSLDYLGLQYIAVTNISIKMNAISLRLGYGF